MTKECLELIYSEVKEKSQRMNMWKGSPKTKAGKIQDKYLKVCLTRYLYFCLLLNQAFVIMYYIRKSPTNLTALTSQYVVLLIFEES